MSWEGYPGPDSVGELYGSGDKVCPGPDSVGELYGSGDKVCAVPAPAVVCTLA